jgi:predicted lipoprotein with Yx(FWY)xxD motif
MAFRSTSALLFLAAMGSGALAQVDTSNVPATTTAEKRSPMNPPEVAMVDDGQKGHVYRRAADGLRLYTYDRDPPGRSTCYEGCAAAFNPLVAPRDAVAVGEWSIVPRTTGIRQWALKGKPVYVMFHDDPVKPAGDGLQGVWHLVPAMGAPVNPPVRK